MPAKSGRERGGTTFAGSRVTVKGGRAGPRTLEGRATQSHTWTVGGLQNACNHRAHRRGPLLPRVQEPS